MNVGKIEISQLPTLSHVPSSFPYPILSFKMPSILTIPSSDVYTIRGIDGKQFFKFTINGVTYRDIETTISNKSLRTTLETLARAMQVSNPAKYKKAELVQIVSDHLQIM